MGTRGRRVSASCAAAVACVLQFATPYAAQEPTFKASNRTVAVYGTVAGPAGRLVPDLTQDAFSITDNGKQQDISLFSNTIEPITAVVLLDRSGGMRANFGLVEKAAEQFVGALKPDDQGAYRKLFESHSDRPPRVHVRSRPTEDDPSF